MKKLIGRGALLAVAIATLVVTTAPSASATSSGHFTLVADMNTPPLGDPGLGSKGSGGVIISSRTCQGEVGNVDKDGKQALVTGTCSLNAGGSLGSGPAGGPWCTHSAGSLNGAVTDASGNGVTFTASFLIDGPTITLTGTATKAGVSGPFEAHGTVTGPTPMLTPGGSCLTGTARDFTVALEGSFTIPTSPCP